MALPDILPGKDLSKYSPVPGDTSTDEGQTPTGYYVRKLVPFKDLSPEQQKRENYSLGISIVNGVPVVEQWEFKPVSLEPLKLSELLH